MNKTERVEIRLSKREKAMLLRQAKKEKKTISEYIRIQVADPPDVTREEYESVNTNLIYEIRKIGVNINQIAKKYNEGRFVEPSDDLMDRMDELKNLVLEVRKIILKK